MAAPCRQLLGPNVRMMKEHYIATHDDISLHVVECGAGPGVLFCHGFPDTWRSWRNQMEAVSTAGFRAIALDTRGHGESSGPDSASEYTAFNIVGDLVAILDALNCQMATLVGHDFGAVAAWTSALVRPDRFVAVFSLSVPPFEFGRGNFLTDLRKDGQHDFYMFRQMRPEADDEWADAKKRSLRPSTGRLEKPLKRNVGIRWTSIAACFGQRPPDNRISSIPPTSPSWLVNLSAMAFTALSITTVRSSHIST